SARNKTAQQRQRLVPMLQCASRILQYGQNQASRVVLCGVLAGVIWVIVGGMITALLGRDFATLPNNRLGAPTPGFLAFNIVVDMLEVISILWLYAAIRP